MLYELLLEAWLPVFFFHLIPQWILPCLFSAFSNYGHQNWGGWVNATLKAAGEVVTTPGWILVVYLQCISQRRIVAPHPTNIPWPPSDVVRMSVMLLFEYEVLINWSHLIKQIDFLKKIINEATIMMEILTGIFWINFTFCYTEKQGPEIAQDWKWDVAAFGFRIRNSNLMEEGNEQNLIII